MPRKTRRPEEIIAGLRQAEVLLGEGKKVPEVVKTLGVHEVTYYRRRKEYGGLQVSQAKRLKELERENARLRRAVSDLTLGWLILTRGGAGRLLKAPRAGAAASRQSVSGSRSPHGAPARALGQQRSTQRRRPALRGAEGAEAAAQEGLRPRLADGSAVRLRRPSVRTTSGPGDFVAEKTHGGRPLKLLTVVDEHRRECLAIVVARRTTGHEVLMTLADLFLEYGVPEHIRLRRRTRVRGDRGRASGSASSASPPCSSSLPPPGRTATVESLSGKLRDELLDGEILYTLKEAQILVAQLAPPLQRPAPAQLARATDRRRRRRSSSRASRWPTTLRPLSHRRRLWH